MSENFYDSYWKSGFHTGEQWTQKRFDRVLGPLQGRSSVLDYGCGMGYNYQSCLVNSSKSYVAADVSKVAIADAKSKGYQTLQIRPDSSIDSTDDSFDGAVCIEVMEHLFDPLAAAKELYRVLEPGGVLVATVPNFGYFPWRLMGLIRARVPSEPEDPSRNRFNGVHIRYFNTSTFRRLFSDAGFSVIEINSFDESTVWDVFRAFGPFSQISDFARNHLPKPFHLSWLQFLMPSIFAYRIRAVCLKP